jgi:hypothetical protein
LTPNTPPGNGGGQIAAGDPTNGYPNAGYPNGGLPVQTAPAAAPPSDVVLLPPTGETPVAASEWDWQIMPDGLIYHSYLAGVKEPRLAVQPDYIKGQGWFWDAELGARAGLFRYGTDDSQHPEGWELDIEGAAFPRLNMQQSENLTAVDFRFGVPLTYGIGAYQTKFGYYHICSHLGDEYIFLNPGVERTDYVRNALVWGNSYYLTENLRIYGEAGWAFEYGSAVRPWEFQFGIEYSSPKPSRSFTPFVAVNADLQQELNFGGSLVVEAGWQLRGASSHLFRAGLLYFTGESDQYQFYNQYEEKIGLGLWYDF